MRRSVVAGLIVVALASVALAFDVALDYVDDITALGEQCYVRAIKLEIVERAGENGSEETILEGTLELADGHHVVRIGSGSTGARLWVDLDGAGELAQMEWERILTDGTFLANVRLTLAYGGNRSPYRLFLMWNPFLPTVVTFCRNSYREGALDLPGRAVRVAIIDADTDGRYDALGGGVLLIDVDGDGELLATGDSHERFFLDEAFNVDGASYRVEAVAKSGDSMRVEESPEPVAPKVPLLPGFAAPSFAAVDAFGESLSLEEFRGRIVVLDFWAGWCAPCVAELPTLRRVVAEFGDERVVVLGINLDRDVDAFRAAVAEHGIDWPQIYDGSGGPIGNLYRIAGIPMTYVINADGVIVARGLRGERLLDVVAEELRPTAEGGQEE